MELVEHGRRRGRDRRSSARELQAAADLLPPSPATCGGACASPLVSSHSTGAIQSTSITCSTIGGCKREDQNVKGSGAAEAGAPKRVRRTRPGIDGGHGEGPACSFQRGQRPRKKRKQWNKECSIHFKFLWEHLSHEIASQSKTEAQTTINLITKVFCFFWHMYILMYTHTHITFLLM